MSNKENKGYRFKKTRKQVEVLNDYYRSYPNWTQNVIWDIAHHSNLPKEKIYKWYWDQNKKYKPSAPENTDFTTEVQVYQGQLFSETHKVYKCTSVKLNQEVSQQFKDRLLNLAQDLILLK